MTDEHRALLNAGPALRDVDAAMDCRCSCHPRVGDLHNGGVTCACQQTLEERKAATEKMFAALAALNHSSDWEAKQDQFDVAAAALGVQNAAIECQACPTVVSGIVDGRFFYLRERSGVWRITVAPENDPLLDVWNHTTTVQGVDIANGSEDDLYIEGETFSYAHVLQFAVRTVRGHLRRSTCGHNTAPTGANFCPTCGEQLESRP